MNKLGNLYKNNACKIPVAMISLFAGYHLYLLAKIDERVEKEIFVIEKSKLAEKILMNRELSEARDARLEEKIDILLDRR